MVYEITPQEVKRKEKERITMLEGIKLWKKQKEENLRKDIKEKQEVRKLLENYWPWGRPGGGAPNDRNVGLRNVYLEEIYPQEEFKKAKRQVEAIGFGRSGDGQRQIRFREDPILRFQWDENLRRTVDNNLRYRVKREEQQHYKKQLDKLVAEKKKTHDQELKKNLDFEQTLGWTTDATIKCMQEELSKTEHSDSTTIKHKRYHNHHNEENHRFCSQQVNHRKVNKYNDVELVPLIIRRRNPAPKVFRETTDVTRGDALPHRIIVAEQKNFVELAEQIDNKHKRMKDANEGSVKDSEDHFRTWKSLWGRPGHGAPHSIKQKRHLMSMLYPQMQPTPIH